MENLSQRDKLINEELKTIAEIESLQNDIDLYKEDLIKIRKHLADLEAGRNDNAWKSFCEYAKIDQE